MREEVHRIIKLVQEGKLSPEDAAELIDAFTQSNGEAQNQEPPPAPHGDDAHKDPFKSFVESMEKLGKDAADSVNWQEIAGQVRQSTKKGVDAMRQSIEEISKGKVNFGWFLMQETKEVNLPIAIPTGKTLRIENPCGNVKVVGGFDLGNVTAHAKFRGATLDEARAKASAYTLIIEESDHLVLIKQPDVAGLVVDLEVQMAGVGSVEVRSESGDISLMDTGGGCRLTGRSGDIRLRGLDGVIEINSTSGDISVENSTTPSLTVENKSGDILMKGLNGTVNVRSSSGDVTARNCKGKNFAVESVSGDVDIDLAEPITGNVNIRTVSGSASIYVPDGSDCLVKMSTLNGAVFCDMPLTEEARTNQRLTGRLGAGGGSLDVSAISGNVSLKLHDAVAAE